MRRCALASSSCLSLCSRYVASASTCRRCHRSDAAAERSSCSRAASSSAFFHALHSRGPYMAYVDVGSPWAPLGVDRYSSVAWRHTARGASLARTSLDPRSILWMSRCTAPRALACAGGFCSNHRGARGERARAVDAPRAANSSSASPSSSKPSWVSVRKVGLPRHCAPASSPPASTAASAGAGASAAAGRGTRAGPTPYVLARGRVVA
mmetsp:Transcript_13733/g.47439  ORF Transcript_13733/g.47439 Transcript_13733/m.47439 type:complete len:209 (-) Transcript_13733:234-860(-)